MLESIRKLLRLPAPERPGCELERLFVLALRDPAARPAFLAAFREAELWVSGVERGAGSFDLVFYDLGGEKVLPVFATEERLKATLKPDARPLRIPARQLWGAGLPCSGWALNPYSALGRELKKAELSEIFGAERPST